MLLDVGASEDVVRRVIEEDPRVAAYLEGGGDREVDICAG